MMRLIREQAMLISLVCLDWPMTPETIRLMQKFDKRWADFLGLYALDADGRVMATCVDGSMSGRDVAELYDANDKRFIMYSLEDF